MKAQVVAVMCYQHSLLQQSKLQLLFIWNAQQTLFGRGGNIDTSPSQPYGNC